jgi:hypothetical protein
VAELVEIVLGEPLQQGAEVFRLACGQAFTHSQMILPDELMPRGVRVRRARSLRRAGIMEIMSNSRSRRFPVTITYLPVTRCQICRRTVAYRPGRLSEVLTEHYRRTHPKALGLPAR